LGVDVNQLSIIFLKKNGNFSQKVLVIRKIVVPLHPLSGQDLWEHREKSSLKDLHRQRKK
jgi:hypothetical protein